MSNDTSNPFKRKKRSEVVRSKIVDEKDRKHKFVSRPTAGEKMQAKSAWLSGLNNSEVLKIANCTRMTLEKWITEWNSERTSAMLGLRAKQLELNVTDVEINEHQVYIDNLRTLKEQYETELPMLSKIANALEKIIEDLENHPDFDAKDFKQMMGLLKTYATAKTSRSALQTNYMTCVNQLNAETGITAYHKAAGNKVNEVYKAEGRLEIARKRRDEGLETSTEKKKGSFFDVD